MGVSFSQYLSLAIFEMKENVIGIIKVGDNYHMITNYDEESATVDTVRLGQLGGVQYDYGMPTHNGKFKLFPDGKTMNEMQEDIQAYTNFYNELLK